MSGYYQANPHYAAADLSEQREREEGAMALAADWFADLTKPQTALFNERMATANEFRGVPRWDRVRDAAKREFERTTADAAAVSDMVYGDMIAAGEVSEATSYAFDAVAAQQPTADFLDNILAPLDWSPRSQAAE